MANNNGASSPHPLANQTLENGHRGLPGSSGLARLLRRHGLK
jgi:hypothetical protein